MAKLPLRPHRYWTATTCPGNPWEQWVPTLREMEDEDMLTPEDKVWITNAIADSRRGILSYVEKAHKVTRASRSGGATPDELTEAVKQAQREGTG